MISPAIERTGISKPTIYDCLRKYWRGGQTKNALAPDFDRRGGRGKTKSSGESKRGRPARRTLTITSDVGIDMDDIRCKKRDCSSEKRLPKIRRLEFSRTYGSLLQQWFLGGMFTGQLPAKRKII